MTNFEEVAKAATLKATEENCCQRWFL